MTARLTISPANSGISTGDPPERPPCTGMSWLFDSTDPETHKEARKMCADCHVIDWCKGELRKVQRAAYSREVGGPVGTWAGDLYNSKSRKVYVRSPDCLRCGRKLSRVRHKVGRPLPAGTVQHCARGLCTACYNKRMGHS